MSAVQQVLLMAPPGIGYGNPSSSGILASLLNGSHGTKQSCLASALQPAPHHVAETTSFVNFFPNAAMARGEAHFLPHIAQDQVHHSHANHLDQYADPSLNARGRKAACTAFEEEGKKGKKGKPKEDPKDEEETDKEKAKDSTAEETDSEEHPDPAPAGGSKKGDEKAPKKKTEATEEETDAEEPADSAPAKGSKKGKEKAPKKETEAAGETDSEEHADPAAADASETESPGLGKAAADATAAVSGKQKKKES